MPDRANIYKKLSNLFCDSYLEDFNLQKPKTFWNGLVLKVTQKVLPIII